MKKNTMDRTVLAAAVIGSLLLLNIIGQGLFERFDLTHDKQFTLSSATRNLLRDTLEPITVRAYFSKDLPQPYAGNRDFVQDLLEEYYSDGRGLFRYEFIDPVEEETQDDKEKKKERRRDIFGNVVREKTSVERELEGIGIGPVQIQVNEGDKLEVKPAYMALAIASGDKQEVLPVVQDTAGLEYTLTTLIRKVTDFTRPKIAFVSGHEGPALDGDLKSMKQLLDPLYEVSELDLSTETTIASDIDAVWVIGPRTPLAEAEQKILDAYLVAGGSAAFMLDSVTPKLPELTTTEANHGLTPMLAGYGMRLGSGLVLDAKCATITVQRKRGFFVINEPVRYPYVPVPESLSADHPMSQGIGGVAFAFTVPITISEQEGLEFHTIAESSETSWIEHAPHDLNPGREWTSLSADISPSVLMVAAKGRIPSRYPVEIDVSGEAAPSAEARIVVAGGSAFLSDQFLAPQNANAAFVLNMMDWLVRDDALLAVRTRGLAIARLDETTEGSRSAIKYGSTIGLPLLLVLFGVVRRLRREARRAHASSF